MSRAGWAQAGPTGVDQGATLLAMGITSKGFPQAWTSSVKQGPTSYSYPSATSSSGRDESSAQAWAQARLMSLTQAIDSKRNHISGVQGLPSQGPQLKQAVSPPEVSKPNLHADYKSIVSRLPPRQNTGGMLSSVPAPHPQGRAGEAFLSKSAGGSEQKGSLNLQPQGNMRPSPLQKSSLQERAMPPDLNVALLSPSASTLQSPQPQQGSTPTSSQQPDLKLQL